MKLTPILYVRSWISKLHPPMLTTKKENKQLLSLLNSSFHRRLDDAHPPIHPIEPSSRHATPSTGPRLDNTSARATRDHLQSLLQHPLLSQRESQHVDIQDAAFKAAKTMDLAMLCGEEAMGLVYASMIEYGKTLGNERAKAQHDGFDVAEKIVAWFTSSSAVTKQKFLSDKYMLRAAVPILYADGQERAVWEWLELLYSRRLGSSDSQPQNDAHVVPKPLSWVLLEVELIRLMMKEDLRRRRLDTAVVHFLQASDYMQSTGRLSPEVLTSGTWQAIIHVITIAMLRRRHQHGLSDYLFDSFLEHRSLWSSSSTFTFELVSLYHPTRPSAKELVNAINQGHDQIQRRFSHIEALHERAKKVILNALLDGVQLLLEQNSNSVKEARLILDLIEKHFPSLGSMKSDESTEKRIQAVRETISPEQVMPTPIGIT